LKKQKNPISGGQIPSVALSHQQKRRNDAWRSSGGDLTRAGVQENTIK
jgi:hypothetical protein